MAVDIALSGTCPVCEVEVVITLRDCESPEGIKETTEIPCPNCEAGMVPMVRVPVSDEDAA